MRTRLQSQFERAASEQRGVLVGFLPAGYPNPADFSAVVGSAFEAGLDALEISLPGPAPALDGPLIRAAATQASRFLADVPAALELAAAARTDPKQVLIALAYNHILEAFAADRLLDELALADIDALLLPEQIMASQIEIGIAAQARGIEPVIFLHLQEDLEELARCALVRPVIYLQSADLQTGGSFNQATAVERLGELAAAFGDKEYWVIVGFGVRGSSEVGPLIEAGASGAIVGTRLVTAASEGADEVSTLIRDITPALSRPKAGVR